MANVVPLFKKGNRNDPGNYRPVSLTSVVGKLMEKVLRNRTYAHLERCSLIRDSQHGFVKGKSCLTNLIEFFEVVTKCVDEDRAVDVVYMDFSKAFDKVPHGRLMKKVRRCGIEGHLADWISNWFFIEDRGWWWMENFQTGDQLPAVYHRDQCWILRYL